MMLQNTSQSEAIEALCQSSNVDRLTFCLERVRRVKFVIVLPCVLRGTIAMPLITGPDTGCGNGVYK